MKYRYLSSLLPQQELSSPTQSLLHSLYKQAENSKKDDPTDEMVGIKEKLDYQRKVLEQMHSTKPGTDVGNAMTQSTSSPITPASNLPTPNKNVDFTMNPTDQSVMSGPENKSTPRSNPQGIKKTGPNDPNGDITPAKPIYTNKPATSGTK